MNTMFLASLVVFALAPAQTGAPVGMILMADGSAQVQRGTARTPARLGDLLYAGDRLTTGAGPVTFLFCPSSERLTARNGMTIELGATVASTAGITRAAARCALPQVALGRESLERVGGMRARGNPPIPLYLGGPVTSTRPTFVWAAVAGAQEYRLSLTDAMGDLVWQMRGTEPMVSYPQTRPPLPQGEFTWEVSAMANGKIIAQQNAVIFIKPSIELSAAAETKDPASLLLRATELENAGYFAEAAGYFRMLRDADSSDDRFSRRLALLYWNAGLIAAVNDEMSKINPQK